jgi:prepilin-type N-terminal cleavage/methylation domain-containing protein
MWQIRRKLSKRQDQRGDTLVEVMIAIVIVATVIGGAYVVSNRSLQSTRSAQERGNALKLGEAQVEQLKALIASDSTKIFGATVPIKFCLGTNGVGAQVVYDIAIPAQKVNCTVDTSGAPATVQPAYTLLITRTGNNFKVTESWIDVSGKFSDSLQLNYRAYQ